MGSSANVRAPGTSTLKAGRTIVVAAALASVTGGAWIAVSMHNAGQAVLEAGLRNAPAVQIEGGLADVGEWLDPACDAVTNGVWTQLLAQIGLANLAGGTLAGVLLGLGFGSLTHWLVPGLTARMGARRQSSPAGKS